MSRQQYYQEESDTSRLPSTAAPISPRISVSDPALYPDLDKDTEKGEDASEPRRDSVGSISSTNHQKQSEFENNIVVFDGPNDPENPKSWSKAKKWTITMSLASMVFTVTFASSVFSTCIDVTAEEFHIGTVVATLGVSLFLVVRALAPRDGDRPLIRF